MRIDEGLIRSTREGLQIATRIYTWVGHDDDGNTLELDFEDIHASYCTFQFHNFHWGGVVQ